MLVHHGAMAPFMAQVTFTAIRGYCHMVITNKTAVKKTLFLCTRTSLGKGKGTSKA